MDYFIIPKSFDIAAEQQLSRNFFVPVCQQNYFLKATVLQQVLSSHLPIFTYAPIYWPSPEVKVISG